jgi:tetratricopeptide (TPR) repeat protein
VGAFDRAVIHFREALRQHPQNPLIRYNLAAALANLGRYQEAKEELETADRLVKLYVANDQTRYRFRALVYERYDPRLAIMSWERYVTALKAISDPTLLQAAEAQNARVRLEWLKKNGLNGAQGQ